MKQSFDLQRSPFIVIWETTQACDLACVHCRATAQPNALPGELTTAEGLELIDQIAAMGTPILVLSGGDPLKRQDLLTLIAHGKALGLRMATIPAATPRLTREAVFALKSAGLDQMALSLDASTAEAHDRFRGAPGAFQKTMQAIEWAHEAGLPLQINTVISAYNLSDLERLIGFVRQAGVVFWEVFFLVPMGRGAQLGGITADQYETVFARLFELGREATFVIKVTEAPHYRRYGAQRQAAEQSNSASPAGPRWGTTGPHGSIGLAPLSINAGKGHLFVSYKGDVYPSGFLPVSAGNIRSARLVSLYQTSSLFLALRDSDRLKGRCGICEFRAMCGGSRSRAFAVTGDYLAEEPCCAYLPAAARQQAGDSSASTA